MTKNQLQSIMVTSLYMERSNLISKEKMKKYCQGAEIGERGPPFPWTNENKRNLCQRGIYRRESINDDLEGLFEDLQTGKLPWYRVDSYFLPELTEVEMVKKYDQNFRQTFRRGFSSDGKSLLRSALDKNEMKMTDSELKFVLTKCERLTYRIALTPGGSSSHSYGKTATEDYYEMNSIYDFNRLRRNRVKAENSDSQKSYENKNICCYCCSVQ